MDFKRFEQMVGLLGAILGIVAFLWQFGPYISKYLRTDRKGLTPAPHDSTELQLPTVCRSPNHLKGLIFAFLAAVVWSISHNTFRTQPALACSAEVMAALVFLGGGLCIAGYCLLVSHFTDDAPTYSEVLPVLATRMGVALVLFNAVEFVLYLKAMHFITAGQTMALWKTNPLWTLIILALFFRKRVHKSSIAAAFCVVAGAYYILAPSISNPDASWNVKGSAFALIGGATFAAYACILNNIYEVYRSASKLHRYWLQALILIVTGLLLCVYNSATGANSQITMPVLLIIVINAVRIAITYILFSEAIALTGSPVLVAAVVCLEVPLTIGVEYFWHGNAAGVNLLAGAAIIIVGVISIIQENDCLMLAIRSAFARRTNTDEHDGGGQPATRPESK